MPAEFRRTDPRRSSLLAADTCSCPSARSLSSEAGRAKMRRALEEDELDMATDPTLGGITGRKDFRDYKQGTM